MVNTRLCGKTRLAFFETLVTFLNCEIETSMQVFKKHRLKVDENFARPMIFEGPFSTHFLASFAWCFIGCYFFCRAINNWYQVVKTSSLSKQQRRQLQKDVQDRFQVRKQRSFIIYQKHHANCCCRVNG